MAIKIESRYYTVKDVETMLGCGKTKAYQVIKQLNTIWEQRGKISVAGKVNRTIFDEFFPQ